MASQSLFFGKPLFDIGTSYASKFSDCNKLSEIHRYFDSDEYKNNNFLNKDSALYHLLIKYWVLDVYLLNKDWLLNFLNKSLTKELNFDFYDDIDEPENVFNNFINKAIQNCMARYSNKEILSLRMQPIRIKDLAQFIT
ncbi:MAG: hypothetical protein MZU91_05820 [Desulfosudis oleivorans]|nr:hypothetical protein [Desulfosudis oleivorans]